MLRSITSRSRSWIHSLAAALVLWPLVGCRDSSSPSGGYDPALTYPLRDDPIIVRLPDSHPTRGYEVGTIDESLRKLTSLRGEVIEPRELPKIQAVELLAALEAEFGRPAEPTLPESLGYSAEQLRQGSRVYSRICRNCHGLNGDGRGPGGPWMVPVPRDFRSGLFEVALGRHKPRYEDLVQLIKHGVPGSNMQAFDLIPDEDLRAAATYTIHLSLRGEVEQTLLLDLLDPSGERQPENIREAVRITTTKLAARWQADQSVDWPTLRWEESESSLRRGAQLFQSVGCASCHVNYGRTETYRYNAWGLPVRVANLTEGQFRWGRAPERIAARIRHGIPGANMPAHPTLTDQQLTDLVGFVKMLSLPDRLPADVRQAIESGS